MCSNIANIVVEKVVYDYFEIKESLIKHAIENYLKRKILEVDFSKIELFYYNVFQDFTIKYENIILGDVIHKFNEDCRLISVDYIPK